MRGSRESHGPGIYVVIKSRWLVCYLIFVEIFARTNFRAISRKLRSCAKMRENLSENSMIFHVSTKIVDIE